MKSSVNFCKLSVRVAQDFFFRRSIKVFLKFFDFFKGNPPLYIYARIYGQPASFNTHPRRG